jgi:hypothetical protein
MESVSRAFENRPQVFMAVEFVRRQKDYVITFLTHQNL